MFEVIDEIIQHKFSKRSEAEELIASILPNPRLSGFLSKNLLLDDEGIISWKFNAQALKSTYQNLSEAVDINGKISSKTLLIKGGKSNYISSEDEINIDQYFSDARVEIIPNAGHWVNVDAPEELRVMVERFLKE
jgi:esterase